MVLHQNFFSCCQSPFSYKIVLLPQSGCSATPCKTAFPSAARVSGHCSCYHLGFKHSFVFARFQGSLVFALFFGMVLCLQCFNLALSPVSMQIVRCNRLLHPCFLSENNTKKGRKYIPPFHVSTIPIKIVSAHFWLQESADLFHLCQSQAFGH